MLPLRSTLGLVCCSAALALNIPASVAFAQPAGGARPAAAPAAPGDSAADQFAVPETNDEQALQLFLQRLVQTPPTDPTPEGVVKHLVKLDDVVVKVLQKPVSDDFFKTVVQLRFQLLAMLVQMENPEAKLKNAAFIAELEKSTREGVPQVAKQIKTQNQIENVNELTVDEQKALLASLLGELKAANKDDREALYFNIQAISVAIELLKRDGSELATPTTKSLIEILKGTEDANLASFIELLEGTVRRDELNGNPIELQGKTLDGKDFKIESLKGKVVLVVFWATAAEASLAELPHVQELYNAYKANGLEVVGVNVDAEKTEVETYLEARPQPWVNLFHEVTETEWTNPVARHYGINAIPAMILVGKDGKVINSDVGIVTLDEELEKVLGPLPDAAPAPAQ